MSTRLKVENGTTPSERLCDTCHSALIYRGEGVGERVICQRTSPEHAPLVKVVKCTGYSDKRDNTPSLTTMTDMAFILTEQGPLKQVGFIPSRKWRNAHKEERILPNLNPWDE